ncbi:MAG: cell wall hydrolase [Kordiimonas sp.]
MRPLRFITKLKLVAAGLILVSAFGTWQYWKYNIEWSARIAWGEARGEPDGGMQAVLNVMMNRKKDPRFPKSLFGVARQDFQFSAYNEGNPNKIKLETVGEHDRQYKRAVRLATFAQLGLLPDLTDGAVYYHSTDIERPYYLDSADVSAKIGKHVFYKEVAWAD